jgi:flagellar basal-body rod protein FlgC
MSNTFGAIDTAGSGLVVYRKWMDAVSDNLANMNNVSATSGPAFQARYVVAQATDYGSTRGVHVGGIALGDAAGRMVYQPGHPLADDEGMVRVPDIDMADQMTQLIMAQRGYQANLAVVDRAHDAYQQALQIGR